MDIDMEIELDEMPFDLDFHPSTNVVATGLLNGKLLLYRYAPESKLQRIWEVKAHKKSCRALRFVNQGRAIITGSEDSSIVATDVETGSPITRTKNAHGRDPIYRLVNLTESTIATGDDEGCIKVWDIRQRSCCSSFHVQQNFISDMTLASDSMKLIATSGDGTLAVCNLRSNKVQTRSKFVGSELHSVVIMKNGRKVICGTQSGALLFYSWGFFKDCRRQTFSDRFVDPSGRSDNPVTALLKLDEDRVITGFEDGQICLVGILPNRAIQLNQYPDNPVERLAFSHDRKFLGSITEETLKLWDLDEFLSGNTAPNHSAASEYCYNVDGMDVDNSIPKPSKGTKRKSGGKGLNSSDGFFAEL